MSNADLHAIARALVAPGKGILAADESAPTIQRRFDGIGVESTETNRRDWRQPAVHGGRDRRLHLGRDPVRRDAAAAGLGRTHDPWRC